MVLSYRLGLVVGGDGAGLRSRHLGVHVTSVLRDGCLYQPVNILDIEEAYAPCLAGSQDVGCAYQTLVRIATELGSTDAAGFTYASSLGPLGHGLLVVFGMHVHLRIIP